MSYILSSFLFPPQNIRQWNASCPRTLRTTLIWRNFYLFQHVNYGTFLIYFKCTYQTERNWYLYAICKYIYCVKKLVRILLEGIYFVIDGHLYMQLLGASMGLVPSPEVGFPRLFDIFENIIYSDHHNTINAAHFKYINDGLNEY